MAALQHGGATAPGRYTPRRDKADGGNVGLVGEQRSSENPDFQCRPCATQALEVIEGEAYSRAYLERLSAGAAQPGELAVILGFLDGAMLHGACRVLEKALRGTR